MGKRDGGRWWQALALLLPLLVACGAGESVTLTSVPTREIPPTSSPVPTFVPLEPTPSLTSVPLPTETSSAQPSTATVAPQELSWYGDGIVALFASGDDDQAAVYALNSDGTTHLVLDDVGRGVKVSPDGRWLNYIRWNQEGQGALFTHDIQSGDSRQISPKTARGLLRFVFHPESRHLVYLDLGPYTDSGVPWALVVVGLESGRSIRYEALMTGSEARPLPGAPVGWSHLGPDRDELIIDTFLPYTEGGWMGVWGIRLPVDGASASLDALPNRELVPAAPVYSSQVELAPDRRKMAFLGRDLDYLPDDYSPEFYDLAVNRLGVADVNDGARMTLLEVTDGSALARALTWSPTGERLLFAQGFYAGDSFNELSLKSIDLSGAVVDYGPLTLSALGGLVELAWCNPSVALYVTWSGGDAMERLLRFDLNTGVSTEIGAARRVEVIGCAP